MEGGPDYRGLAASAARSDGTRPRFRYTAATLRRFRLNPGRAIARPFLTAAALAYLLLPLLYAGHVGLAHDGKLEQAVAVHFAPRSHDAPGEHPPHAGHCDLCRLLASVSTGGEPVATTPTLLLTTPAATGRICCDIDRPFLGRVVPVALLPRAPPLI